MLNTNDLKHRGLRYLRSLQVVFRMAAMFSADHVSAAGPMQQSFDSLNALLKEVQQLTVGFVDGRVMINKILTTEPAVKQLENEFLKRGIGGVSFEAGVTLGRYKHLVGVLATHPKTVEEMGGVHALIANNPIEGVRIFPAGKNQARTEDGDTIIDQDSESFLRSKQFADQQPVQIPLAGLELIFESAGVEKPADLGRGPEDIMRIVGPTVEAALTAQQGDPQKSYFGLARLLQDVSPNHILSLFPAERQEGLKDKPPQELAAEFIEETATRWAMKKLTAPAASDDDPMAVEEDVVRVLLRTLQATQTAERLAMRLAEYVKQYTLPKPVYERLQEELRWTAYSPRQKFDKMMALKSYNRLEFRRLVELIKDFISQTRGGDATTLAKHYLEFLDDPPESVQPETFTHANDLLRAMAGVRTDFAEATIARFGEALLESKYSQFIHYQVANCISTLSKSIAVYEEFAMVQEAGNALQRSIERDPAAHSDCCGLALNNLLAPTSIERIIELLLAKRDDAAWVHTATALLRWSGTAAVEKVFQRLEEETVASNRLALVRFIGFMGESGIEVARQRAHDTRWYVQRNACQILGQLKDPDLLVHVGPLLKHSDARVQHTAFAVLTKSRLPNRGPVLAAALTTLRAQVLEQALDELLFLKDPACVEGLEAFVFDAPGTKRPVEKAIHALTAIEDESATRVLSRALADASLPLPVRRAAMQALSRRGAVAELNGFAAGNDVDPMVVECRQALGRSAAAG